MALTGNAWFGLTALVLIGATAGILIPQRRAAVDLERELELAREQQRRAANVRSEIARLAAQQPDAAELERLRADREAMQRLRAEIEALKASAKKPPAVTSTPATTKESSPPEGTFAGARKAKSDEWRNVGRATPIAAFETALWAAAAGDIDQLARGLVFDPAWRAQVDQLWGQLSETTRAEYATPERLFAALTAKDIPLGTAQVMVDKILKPGEMGINAPGEAALVMAALFKDDPKWTKHVGLLLLRSDDGWRLVVPGEAVKNYRNLLTGPERTTFEVSTKR